MLKKSCIAVVLFLAGTLAVGQKTFLNFYGQADADYGNVVVSTSDRGYAHIVTIGGGPYLYPALVKTDCNGNIEWTRAYRMDSNFGTITTCYNLVTVPTHGYLMLLNYRQLVTGNYMTAVVLLDLSGNVVWTRSVPMLVSSVSGNVVVNASGIIICGNPNNVIGSLPSLALVQFDYLGNVVRSARLHIPGFCTPFGITHLSNGNYVVTGTFPSAISGFSDVFVISINTDFDPIRTVVYSTFYDDEPFGIDHDENDNVFICGRSYFLGSQYDGMLLKLNKNLDLLFDKYYDAGTPQGEIFRDIIVNNNGYVVMCGDIGAFDERDPVLLSTSNAGFVSFAKKYPISPMFTNYFFSLDKAIDGGLVATGDVRPPTSFRDAPLLKTNAFGDDNCYAQAFFPQVIDPDHTFNDTVAVPMPFNFPVDTTRPFIDTSLIHQVFDCNPLTPCPDFNFAIYDACPTQCAHFIDHSIGGISWLWEFEGAVPSTSVEQHPQGICYAKSGKYKVKLTVSGPTSSAIMGKELEINIECHPVFPNIITPDGNRLNDVFLIGQLPESYELKIFNRWGVLLETITEASNKSWTTYDKDGNKAAPGVYYYTFTDRVTGINYKGFVQVSY